MVRSTHPELEFEIVEQAGVAPEAARCVQSALRQSGAELAGEVLVYVRLR